MIPSEIAELAYALEAEFSLDFDEAVRRAGRVFEALRDAGYSITESAK